MLASILASGLAVGAIYALIGVTYNTMFSTSRVMSFTAGQLGMLGGVFGSLFMLRLGLPLIVGLAADAGGCALVGVVTEFVAVRPVLKSLDQHLYVLSTLALALMIQQVAAIEWSTEPQPFPAPVRRRAAGVWDEKFWLPVVACAVTIVGPRISLSPHPGRPRLPGDRRGQFRRPRARPAGAQSAHRQLCAGRRDRRRSPASPAASCCWPSSPTARC